MEQTYRRQLLALGRLDGEHDEVDTRAREFIRDVLAGPLTSRPNTQGVEDVLSSSGAAAATVARFAHAFHAAVWDVSATRGLPK